ncbi:MAG TPA: protein kinase [Thermoanaerobaculia bacterium]|nr:protein kinase [Thermoanaerobaculia bacterium]
MQLAPGVRIGSYEIAEPIGSGGMGHVYRATDTRLGRDVAIKVLPDATSHDEQALARFDREARLLASINHPNVASIYGLEVIDGERFLILELILGETLDSRISRGAIPVPEALRIAADIAAGLSAAHEVGVVHRDLKPANVMLTTDGHAKILDFGIARNLLPANPPSPDGPTEEKVTRAGAVIGTPAYMSPEQLRGAAVDKRTDIWGFGCVLFEMLTGRRPFPGPTAYAAAAAIQKDDPDWSALPRETPPAVIALLKRCLKKDAAERPRDAGDLRLEITGELHPAAQPHRRSPIVIAAASAITAFLIIGVVLFVRSTRYAVRSPAPVKETLSQLTVDEGVEEFPAFSPSGQDIVYSSMVGPVRKLFTMNLSTREKRQLTSGESDDLQPWWSRDGKQIVFVRSREPGKRIEPGDVFGQYDGADLVSLDLPSKKETLLAHDAFYPSVSPDGKSIAVDASWGGPRRIWIVNERGGNAQQVTSEASEAVVHIAPRWSPDGRKIVFQKMERTKFDIDVVDVSSRRITPLTDDLHIDINPVWSASGRFVFFSSYRSGGMNVWRLPMKADGTAAGAPELLTSGAGQDVQLAASPKGNSLALAILRQNADLWTLPLDSRGEPQSPQAIVATTREDSRGAWSADGKSIAFNSDRGGEMNIWTSSSDGSGARQLTRGEGGDFQPSWSPDGSHIVFFSSRSGNADVWDVQVTTGRMRQLTHTPALEINPFYSPRGDEIAFQSDQDGRLEVWVMKSDGSNPRQLSTIGVSGHFLRWTAGGEVLFRCPCNGEAKLMRVPSSGGGPQPVMSMPKGAGAHMSFSPDGSEMFDVVGHKTLWRFRLPDGTATKLFEFPDRNVRIDYPVLSPDGHAILFDGFHPEGGDLWLMQGAGE